MLKVPRKNIGQELNEKWNVHAHHALYRETGTWYHRLRKFPGALFDATGYILFNTEEDYLNCPYLQLGKQTSCPAGISAVPGYVHVRSSHEQASDLAEPESAERVLCFTTRIIRDTPLARQVKRLHKSTCQLCGLTLTLFEGRSYAEAHHIRPLGSAHGGPDVMENIICVCPNCHALLDYGAIPLSKCSLRLISEHHIGDEYVSYHNSEIYKGSTDDS